MKTVKKNFNEEKTKEKFYKGVQVPIPIPTPIPSKPIGLK